MDENNQQGTHDTLSQTSEGSVPAATLKVESLPCPFCGETRHVQVERSVDPDNVPFMWAECQYCGTQGPVSPSDDEAIARWNGRGREARQDWRGNDI